MTTSVTRTSSTDPVRPVSHTGTSGRRVAVLGALVELAAERRMESSLGISRETLHQGRAGSRLDAAKILATAGALGAATVARRSRLLAAASGASPLTRFGLFEAGKASARDPRYTVEPQRARQARRNGEQ